MLNKEIYKILKSNLFFFFVLFSIVFILYGKSLNYGYTNHDDISLIQDKIILLSDIRNIPKLFTTSCFYSKQFQYYRPVLTLSFAIETIIFGENIFIYHLTNIILFILTLWLMYVFLSQLNLNKSILKFLILLMTIHPILTSCAVWIPARNDTLLIVFMLSSFIFFIKYLNNDKNIFIVISFMFFLLALFTKEITLMSIIVYIYLAFFFDFKINKKNIFLFTSTIFLSIFCFFYLKSISTLGLDLKHYMLNSKEYFFNIFIWTSIYIKQIFVPFNTPIMLYKPSFNSNIFCFFIICFIVPLYLALKNILNKKIIFFGLLWVIVFLIPTYFLYDCLLLFHRIFLPIVGVIIILCELVDKFLRKFIILQKIAIYLFVGILVSFFYLSNIQADKYMNEYVYWNNAYNDAPNYHVACLFKSYIEFEKGNFDKSEELIKKAMEYNYKLYISNFAVLLFEQKKYEQARSLFLESIKQNISVALSYKYLSKISLFNKDFNKAIEYANLAVQEDPYNDNYRKHLQNLINEKNNI